MTECMDAAREARDELEYELRSKELRYEPTAPVPNRGEPKDQQTTACEATGS